mmetsp:Transcript_50971/g.91138  ORF Transcript_50971/g.91138 Transcript_50971/m.91138 type:complete len:891 (+) Transcript_50971:77-2749(+)
MSTLSFHLFDERRTGVTLSYLSPRTTCPLEYDRSDVPAWVHLVPHTLIRDTQDARNKFLSVLSTNAKEDDHGFGTFLKYHTMLSQFQAAITDCFNDMEKAKDSTTVHLRDAKGTRQWARVEALAVLYNLAVAKGRQGTTARFTAGYGTQDVKDAATFNESCKTGSQQPKIGNIEHVQRLFEEAAGLMELLMTTGDEYALLDRTSYPELDTVFLRVLSLSFLGCAHESLWLFHTARNLHGRFCGLLASGIGHFFAQAHALCCALDNPELDGYQHKLENTLAVKRSFYNGVAQYFFNPRNGTRRKKSREHLETAMQLLVKVDTAFRKQAADELMGYYKEVAQWKENRHVVGRFPADGQGCKDEPAPYKSKPIPKLPKEVEAARMYLYWKKWTEQCAAGVITPSPIPKEKEWWEEDEEKSTRPTSPATKSAIKSELALRPAPCQEEEEPALAMTCVLPQRDLYTSHVRAHHDLSPQLVPCVVDIQTQKSLDRKQVSLCLLLVVDCTDAIEVNGEYKFGLVSNMLKDLIQSIGLTNNDYVGIVSFPPLGTKGRTPQVEVVRMDAAGIIHTHKILDGLKKTENASITDAIMECIVMLGRNQVDCSSYELLIFSDGMDTDGFQGAWSNWGRFHEMIHRVLQTSTDPSKKQLRINAFAIGTSSDKYLLQAVCEKSGGDYGQADATADGLSQIRTWFLQHFAEQFSKIATKCTMEIECAPGVSITQFGMEADGTVYDVHESLSSSADCGQLHDWFQWENGDKMIQTQVKKVVAPMRDFSVGHRAEVPIAFYVSNTAIIPTTTSLCQVKVTYTDAHTKDVTTIQTKVSCDGIPSLLDQRQHAWMPSVFVTKCVGTVAVSPTVVVPPQSGSTLYIRSGDWIDPRDTVSVSKKIRIGVDMH